MLREPLPQCNCQLNKAARYLNLKLCEVIPTEATTACFNPDQANSSTSACCAYHSELPFHDNSSGCRLSRSHGHVPCSWDSSGRIAWLHMPKSGTSMLTWLGRLANSSLPDKAYVFAPKRNVLQWEEYFRRWPTPRWFQGSATFWKDGIEHAPISQWAWTSFKGRFFANFRDPRERGWSSYYYFANGSRGVSNVTAQQYARECFAGTTVGMLTGQLRNDPFGSLDCHVVTNMSGLDHACKPCRPFVPNMRLAKQRLDEGFAFVGLTEEWALSACLFSAMFNVRCDRQMMANTRPGWLPAANQSRGPGDDGDDPFADPSDMQLHRWVVERFQHDLRRWRVTPERCARELCPAAADAFHAAERSVLSYQRSL